MKIGTSLALHLGDLDITKIQRGKPIIVDATDSVRLEQWGKLATLVKTNPVSLSISQSNKDFLNGTGVGQAILNRARVQVLSNSLPSVAA